MTSMEEGFSLGPAAFVAAEAIGVPGRRRFRLKAVGERGGAVSLWMEKEQLAALGDAIREILAEREVIPEPLPDDSVFPAIWDCDFKLAQLALAYDEERAVFIVQATPLPDQEGAPPSCSLSFTFAQGKPLAEQIAAVVAAGRPRCPLCSAPMNPEGHVCVRSNGHHPD